MKPDSNRLMAIDAGVTALVSAAISVAGHQLVFMTIFVPVVILARFLLVFGLAGREGVNRKAELVFFLLCTALGAFNDWNSVCNRKIYDYCVPHFFSFSTIPLWMLLFWGMILRFFARLARWEGLRPDEKPCNRVGLGRLGTNHPAARVIAELCLLMATRWFIYRFYLDPVLSWLPFLAGLLLFALFFRPGRHDAKLVALFLVIGPLIEVLYIRVGRLHVYHLGWFCGVPLWIVLWWALSILIWKDLAFRIERFLRESLFR